VLRCTVECPRTMLRRPSRLGFIDDSQRTSSSFTALQRLSLGLSRPKFLTRAHNRAVCALYSTSSPAIQVEVGVDPFFLISHPARCPGVSIPTPRRLCLAPRHSPRPQAPSTVATLPSLRHTERATASMSSRCCARWSARELLFFVGEIEREGVLVQKEKHTGGYV
jgi:hypothetical protein